MADLYFLILGKLDMLGLDEHEAIFNPAFIDALLDIRSNIDECASGGDLEPKCCSITFHL